MLNTEKHKYKLTHTHALNERLTCSLFGSYTY